MIGSIVLLKPTKNDIIEMQHYSVRTIGHVLGDRTAVLQNIMDHIKLALQIKRFSLDE